MITPGLMSQMLSNIDSLQIQLDSGLQRHDAHRLYLNYGFKIIGHHFSLDLKENVQTNLIRIRIIKP